MDPLEIEELISVGLQIAAKLGSMFDDLKAANTSKDPEKLAEIRRKFDAMADALAPKP